MTGASRRNGRTSPESCESGHRSEGEVLREACPSLSEVPFNIKNYLYVVLESSVPATRSCRSADDQADKAPPSGDSAPRSLHRRIHGLAAGTGLSRGCTVAES